MGLQCFPKLNVVRIAYFRLFGHKHDKFCGPLNSVYSVIDRREAIGVSGKLPIISSLGRDLLEVWKRSLRE